MPSREALRLQLHASILGRNAAQSIAEVCDRLDFLEVCCPEDSWLAEEMEKLGASVGRVGLFNGFDLFTSKGERRLLSVVREHKPRDVFLSPVCKAWSQANFWNSGNPERVQALLRLKKKSRRMLLCCRRVIALVQSYGGNAHLEQPTGANSWTEEHLLKACRSLTKAQIGRAHV